jgi:hypothetical protein
MVGRIMCRIGLHRWERRRTEDGQWYVACARCDKDGPYDPDAVDNANRTIGPSFGP